MNNIDKYDDEIKKEKKIHVGFVFNIRQMNNIIDDIVDNTGEYDEKYPKSELIKIWASVMVIFGVLFFASVNVFILVTLPLLFFYFYTLLQVFKAYKRFKYNRIKLLLLTILIIIIEIVVVYFIRMFVFK